MLGMLFPEALPLEQQQEDTQLVTVVITIHDDALQQALQQARHDLQTAQAHSAELQAQADSLRAELHSAADKLSSASALAGAYSAESGAPHSQQAPPDSATQASGQPQLTEQSSSQAESVVHNSGDAVSAEQHSAQSEAATQSAKIKQLLEQLHGLQQQATNAAVQHGADSQAVADLQRQLTRQKNGLSEEREARQTLQACLESAEASLAESTNRIQQLRYVSSCCCCNYAPQHAASAFYMMCIMYSSENHEVVRQAYMGMQLLVNHAHTACASGEASSHAWITYSGI